MKKMAIYLLCACMVQPAMVQADTTEDAIQYEMNLIEQAEAEGQEGLVFATLDTIDTDAEDIETTAEDTSTDEDAEPLVIAAKTVPSKATVTLYSTKDRYWAGKTKQVKNKSVLCTVKGKVTNLKSKNSAVAQLLTSTSRGYTTVYVKAKKEGTAVVSFKLGKKTYKTKVTVKKYANPVQQVKVGTAVQSGTQFASSSILKVSCGKNLGKKTPVSITLNSGWSISSMTYTQKGATVSVSMKNGDSILLQKKLVVNATVINNSTKQTEDITIRFN